MNNFNGRDCVCSTDETIRPPAGAETPGYELSGRAAAAATTCRRAETDSGFIRIYRAKGPFIQSNFDLARVNGSD